MVYAQSDIPSLPSIPASQVVNTNPTIPNILPTNPLANPIIQPSTPVQRNSTPTLSDNMRVMQYFPGDIMPMDNEKNIDVIKRIKLENTGLVRFRYDEQDYRYNNKENRGTEITDRFHDIKTPLPKFSVDANIDNTYQNEGTKVNEMYAEWAYDNDGNAWTEGSGYIEIPLAEYYTSTYMHIQNMFPMAQNAYINITNPYDILYGIRSEDLNILYNNDATKRDLKGIIKTEDTNNAMIRNQNKFTTAFKTDDLYQYYAGDGTDEDNKNGGGIYNPEGTNPTASLKDITDRQGYTIKTVKNNLDDDIIYRSSNEYFGSNNATYSATEGTTAPQDTAVGNALGAAGGFVSEVADNIPVVSTITDGVGVALSGAGNLINNIFNGNNKNNYPEEKDVKYSDTGCPTASTLQKNMYFYDYRRSGLDTNNYVKDANNLKVVDYIYDYTWEDYATWSGDSAVEKEMKGNNWMYKDWNNNGISDGEVYVKDGTMSASVGDKPYLFCVPNVAMGLEQGSKFIRGKLDSSISESRSVRNMAVGLTKWMLQLVAVLAVIGVVYAGYLYMTAWGDEGNISTAKTIITADVIGVVLIFGAYAIVSQFTGQLVYEAPPITPDQARLLGFNEQTVNQITDIANNPLTNSRDKTYTGINEVDPITGQRTSMQSVILDINEAFCNQCSSHCTQPTASQTAAGALPQPVVIPAPEDDSDALSNYVQGQVPPTPAGYLAAYCFPTKPQMADNWAEVVSNPAGAGAALLSQLEQAISTFDDTYLSNVLGEDTNNKCNILREEGKPVVWVPKDYNDLINEYRNKYDFMCE